MCDALVVPSQCAQDPCSCRGVPDIERQEGTILFGHGSYHNRGLEGNREVCICRLHCAGHMRHHIRELLLAVSG